MTEDAARALADRLRSGSFSPADLELACRAVEQRGIPPGEVRRIRNEAYRRYCRAMYPNRSAREQARLVVQDVTRYAASAWLKDQHSIFVPDRLFGTPRAFLWEALRHGDIPSIESMRLILR